MNWKRRIDWSLIGLLLVFVTGCSGRMLETVEPSAETVETISDSLEEPRVTPTVQSTMAIPTAPPTATMVLPTTTPSPTPRPTSTPRPTAIPTLPPLPTIPPEERGQAYASLMSSNGGCDLPCWWGIKLGESSIEEVRQLYASFGAYINSDRPDREGRSVISAMFVDPQIEDGIQVNHVFLAQDGVIIEAEIDVYWDPNYQIEALLQRLGQPSEVWIWTIPEERQGALPMDIRLYFPEKGVHISYGILAERSEDMVQTCFDRRGGSVFYLWNPAIWDPDNVKGFVERASRSSQLTLRDTHRPIAQVSNWDVEAFYTNVMDPNSTDCLQTPAELWPDPGVE